MIVMAMEFALLIRRLRNNFANVLHVLYPLRALNVRIIILKLTVFVCMWIVLYVLIHVKF